MAQHTLWDPARDPARNSSREKPEERPSEPPEPTHSERRLRSPLAPASDRPSRPSVRPSAFGAPRASQRPSAPPSPPRAPAPAEAAARDGIDHEYDADTSPGLNVSALSSPILEGWGPDHFDGVRPDPSSVAHGRVASVKPSAQQRPPTLTPNTPNHAPALKLMLGRTSLPDTPAALLTPPQTKAEEPRRAASRMLVFAAMLCAAGVPLARYALGAESTAPVAVSRAGASAPRLIPRANEHPAPPVVQPAAPVQRPDRMAEIMAALPQEAEAASNYLVDHAVRAKDSGELQLAETLLGRASQLDDKNPHPAYALANLRFEQGNFEGAEGWIASAIRLRPRRAEYHALYAQVLERLGREREARDERRRAKRLSE